MNPNWWRTIIAIILLAILLRAGLGIPLSTSIVFLSIIFVMHVATTNMGTSIATLWEWCQSAANVLVGVVIFLAMRFFVAKLLGVYPIDTYGEVNTAGGLHGILPGKDISTIILWEVFFALVAGGLSVAWVKGEAKARKFVGAVLIFSLLLLTIQIAFPSYVNSWADRTEVSSSLEEKGVVGTLWNGAWKLLFGKFTIFDPTPTTPASNNNASEPLRGCNVPCTMYWDYDETLKSKGRPFRLRIKGTTNWIPVSGAEDEKLPLAKFKPGNAEFDFPEHDLTTPVRVEVFPAK